MAGQEQIRGNRREDDDALPDAVVATPVSSTDGLDDILDEIDGVLETNAEEFVASFVQKGGQ